MSRVLDRIAMASFALLIAVGLAFGASEAFASARPVCGDDLGEIGTCPPFTNESCDQTCQQPPHNFFGGECIFDCCVCLT